MTAAEQFDRALCDGTLCVICGRRLLRDDWDAQRVVASVIPEGVAACCAEHLTVDGPDGPKYHAAVQRIAQVVAAQLRDAKMRPQLPTEEG